MYAAICYEFLGQAAHIFSNNKISFLTQALDHFVGADGAFPAPIILPRLPIVEDESRPATPTCSEDSLDSLDTLVNLDTLGDFNRPENAFVPEPGSMVEQLLRVIDSALLSLDDDPFFDDDEMDYEHPFSRALMDLAAKTAIGPLETRIPLAPSRVPIVSEDPTKKELVPRPLRIDNIAKLKASPAKITGKLATSDVQCNGTGRYRPPRLPLKIITANGPNVDVSAVKSKPSNSSMPVLPHPLPAQPDSITTDPTKELQVAKCIEDIDPVSAARIVRSNRGIALLHDLISTNIAEIHRHIDQVTEVQRARRARKIQRAASFWSFRPIQSGESTTPSEREPALDEFGNILVKETRSERIARLRAEGWKTVGLRSPRSTWKGARYYQEFCAMVLNELYLDN
ncbi:hypothetical protein N7492_006033 [Penicillium capsulatum]|uniref:Uncharacterized protein n=1 Tax=Penicillium capsulatum TaxID=69766 RepID=A0A9W9LSH9_9EURO|nr:hypothetical protein N7492_006033 [Penicillium capsulatum]KAJ6134863.1 hypothetical protein N7512_000023 [Penicillium capsulatum]